MTNIQLLQNTCLTSKQIGQFTHNFSRLSAINNLANQGC